MIKCTGLAAFIWLVTATLDCKLDARNCPADTEAGLTLLQHEGQKRRKASGGKAKPLCPGTASAAEKCHCKALASATLGENISIANVTSATAGTSHCLVHVVVEPSITVLVRLPNDGTFNGRYTAIGGFGFCGYDAMVDDRVPASVLAKGHATSTSDSGHQGVIQTELDGSFALLEPGVPAEDAKQAFAVRSSYMMAVVSKQLIQLFYGQEPALSYWFGCSGGGRQGMAMAQRYPTLFNGIVATSPVVNTDKAQANFMWPAVAKFMDAKDNISEDKMNLAVDAAIAACDADDGVVDGLIMNPLKCKYSAKELICSSSKATNCLSAGEASAIDKIWDGATDSQGRPLWYGLTRGSTLRFVAGPEPFKIGTDQAMYWVYLDPDWDWRKSLNYDNFQEFFDNSTREVAPWIATDSPDLSEFREAGGKLLMIHGLSDEQITPQVVIDYYEQLVQQHRSETTSTAEAYAKVSDFARMFLLPGNEHCSWLWGLSRDANMYAVTVEELVETMVQWLEQDVVPDTLLTRAHYGQRTRPACPWPREAVYKGSGSTTDADSFTCQEQSDYDFQTANLTAETNLRVFGSPYTPL